MLITGHATDAAVEGHLDSSTSRELEDLLCARMQAQPAAIIDMKRVQYVTSAGLRVLLKPTRIARGTAHRPALTGWRRRHGKCSISVASPAFSGSSPTCGPSHA